MSGAVAAHASYNGSGTQGLAVTNKINPAEGDVMSVFWNKNDTTRQLLYGSSTIEIPSSGTGGTASFGGSQVFTVNNDIDCLGDMYVAVTLKVDTSTGQYVDPYFLAKVINRVEFQEEQTCCFVLIERAGTRFVVKIKTLTPWHLEPDLNIV